MLFEQKKMVGKDTTFFEKPQAQGNEIVVGKIARRKAKIFLVFGML
ncbi:hypothetical protein Halhy_5640 [Haliscomenobacter hydrossis DSM 1100]|uniref:Uncharacterized protein n=1 Tax=Haliscomenobacter hydrossis (strain ATCC 27775 / DSM 1100 / LMG 10767 / O) TaxID=760192 RepID=F4KUR0_HALH1|nr:hypothetical protein Halhy_5640 [Haliscomenobacter hydrossis DSM 1100]